jgi:Tfp pilus assembly protein PilN
MSSGLRPHRRVNFIPAELRPTLVTPRAFVAIAAAALLGVPATGMGVRAWRWTAERHLASAEAARNALNAELTLRVQARDTSQDHRETAAVQKALAEKVFWADAFKELTNLAPKSVWLTTFNAAAAEADGKKVTIEGMGTSQPDIAEFFSRLEKSYFFRYVQIKYTEMAEVSGEQVFRFQFEGKVFDDGKGGRLGQN